MVRSTKAIEDEVADADEAVVEDADAAMVSRRRVMASSIRA